MPGIKNLPANAGDWIQSLEQEDPLEEGMPTHSSILAWRILWTEQPGGLQSMELQRVVLNWATNTFIFFHTVSSIISYLTLRTVPGMSLFKVCWLGSWLIKRLWIHEWMMSFPFLTPYWSHLFLYIYNFFTYLCLVMLGLRCYSGFSLFEVSDGYSAVTVCGWSTL